ncbi:YgaP family membrane protein [Jannaschia rubra]|uniref:YgaP family membrane protein n=1 Tax=Jannaschia rubra TaxID=282197 RepID=UPI002490699F|nr:DUF2892 domain-containing protein [Jannaschia rubra]
MRVNEGTTDRVLRAIIGIVLIALPVFATLPIFANGMIWWGSVIVGAVLLITAITGFCPAYRLLGLKTCADC